MHILNRVSCSIAMTLIQSSIIESHVAAESTSEMLRNFSRKGSFTQGLIHVQFPVV